MPPQPTIIVICGGPGVGKSTLAHHLGRRLDIRHRAGTATIMTTLRSIMPRRRVLAPISQLTTRSLSQLHVFLVRRAHMLTKPVNLILSRCAKSGTSFILEGGDILPRFLDQHYLTLCLTIAAPSEHLRASWLRHPTSKRRVRPYPLRVARRLNAIHLTEAQRTRTPIIVESEIGARVRHVLRLLKRRSRALPAAA